MIEIKSLISRSDLDWSEKISIDDAYEEIVEYFDDRYFTHVCSPQKSRLEHKGGYVMGWAVSANIGGCSHTFRYYSHADANSLFLKIKSLIK